MTLLLETQALVAGYGPSPVLRGVDCSVRAGELWAVLGPNGTGKSTLLRGVLGMLPWTRGAVRLLGKVKRLRDDLQRRMKTLP